MDTFRKTRRLSLWTVAIAASAACASLAQAQDLTSRRHGALPAPAGCSSLRLRPGRTQPRRAVAVARLRAQRGRTGGERRAQPDAQCRRGRRRAPDADSAPAALKELRVPQAPVTEGGARKRSPSCPAAVRLGRTAARCAACSGVRGSGSGRTAGPARGAPGAPASWPWGQRGSCGRCRSIHRPRFAS
jgi:hypothetical protein